MWIHCIIQLELNLLILNSAQTFDPSKILGIQGRDNLNADTISKELYLCNKNKLFDFLKINVKVANTYFFLKKKKTHGYCKF